MLVLEGKNLMMVMMLVVMMMAMLVEVAIGLDPQYHEGGVVVCLVKQPSDDDDVL